MKIRPFHNADVPELVRLWVEHWSAIGPPPRVNQAQFEQAILARTFFDPLSLLVAEAGSEDAVDSRDECDPKQWAEDKCLTPFAGNRPFGCFAQKGSDTFFSLDTKLVAWCHFARNPREQIAEQESTTLLNAICLGASADPSVGPKILSAAESVIAKTSHSIRVGVVRDDQQGYAGLEPIGFGAGIPVADYRTAELLQEMGYTPLTPLLRMVAAVDQYRPPFSREAMQFRRSAQIQWKGTLADVTRTAVGLSHLDVATVRLATATGESLAEVDLWMSDAEAEVMSPNAAILDLRPMESRGRLHPAESYLIGALVQSLGQRNIQTVETVIDSDQPELLGQLQKLQFQTNDEGMCWEKHLDR